MKQKIFIESFWKHFQTCNASSFQCTFAPQRLIGETFQFDFLSYTALLCCFEKRSGNKGYEYTCP